jgi:hypoxanthine phosphoribosyltransferase
MAVVLKPLFSEIDINKAVQRLACQIIEDLSDEIHVVAVLKGSYLFFADLSRELVRAGASQVYIHSVEVNSYHNHLSSGILNLISDIDDVKNLDLLIVEDIADSGRTLEWLKSYFLQKGAQSVKSVCLLDKPTCREVEFKVDYTGFEVPDVFVVGYGMDYNQKYRALAEICILEINGD